MSQTTQNTAHNKYGGYDRDRHSRLPSSPTPRLVELPRESSVDPQNVRDGTGTNGDVQIFPGTSRKRPARPAEPAPNSLHLPVEMWQTVFRNLKFFDLIRCRLVSKEWAEMVSGALELRDLLFTNRQEDLEVAAGGGVEDDGEHDEDNEDEADDDEDDDEDDDDDDDDDDSDGLFNKYSNYKSSEHWLNHRKGKKQADNDSEDEENEYEQQEEEEEESEIPQININLKALIEPWYEKNVTPKMIFGIDVDFGFKQERSSSNEDPVLNFKEGTGFHPMLENIEKYMDLVNGSFGLANGESRSVFSFDHFDELGVTELRPMNEANDGSWKNHLICRPPVERVDVFFQYKRYEETGRTFQLFRQDGRGVTMGQFVRAFRQQFSRAKADFGRFSTLLQLRCDGCTDELDY